jgi:hypothetical protein
MENNELLAEIADVAGLSGADLLALLESRGYVSVEALADVGLGFSPALKWLAVTELSSSPYAQRLSPSAVGEVALFTVALPAIPDEVWARVGFLRKRGWQVIALPMPKGVLLALGQTFSYGSNRARDLLDRDKVIR